jgi:hypothetical protein
MELGKTFTSDGITYVIKKIDGEIIRASKMVGEGAQAKISRGQPKIFSRKAVEVLFGVLDEEDVITSSYQGTPMELAVDKPSPSWDEIETADVMSILDDAEENVDF